MAAGAAQRQDRGRARPSAIEVASATKTVVRDFTGTILRGDKVGLIGPNGAGKTTLLKLILGELEPDGGKVRRGANLQVAYFDQMRDAARPRRDAAKTHQPRQRMDRDRQPAQARHELPRRLPVLAGARATRRCASLSGGERNRLLLARLFARPANVLVLDEPTNDLDIETLELLEELLQDYAGTVFLVSHDRAFLDNVVTSTIAFEGDGRWREYEGGVQDWLIQSKRAREIARAAAGRGAGALHRRPSAPAPAPAAERRRPRRHAAQEAQLQGAARTRSACPP